MFRNKNGEETRAALSRVASKAIALVQSARFRPQMGAMSHMRSAPRVRLLRDD